MGKKPRCSLCRRKLSLGVGIDCKHCSDTYCISCLLPEVHHCKKAKYDNDIILPSCKPKKIDKL
jgi:hypothetical protein